jgi:hypothetical protein
MMRMAVTTHSLLERILVFIQWAIQDLTFSRGARLITGTAATDFNFDRELASVAKKPAEADKIAVNV